MSHEIETMAFVGETPWHGLGRTIDMADAGDLHEREYERPRRIAHVHLQRPTSHGGASGHAKHQIRHGIRGHRRSCMWLLGLRLGVCRELAGRR